jgi:hypothetical protein
MIAAQMRFNEETQHSRKRSNTSSATPATSLAPRFLGTLEKPAKILKQNLLLLEHRRALFIKQDCAFELAEIRCLIGRNLHLPHHIVALIVQHIPLGRG